MDERNERDDGAEKYWAAAAPDELLNECQSRVDEFFRDEETIACAELVARNWCYYHGVYNVQRGVNFLGGSAIQHLGRHGERKFMGLNNFRNLLSHLHILATRDRAAPKAVASNTDFASLMAAQTVDAVLDEYLTDKRVDRYFSRAAEQAIVATRGFVSLDWDIMSGREVGADTERGMREYEGDLSFGNPNLFDVVRDYETHEGFEGNQWAIVRDWPNRWDLAALHPDKKDAILSSSEPDETLFFNRRRERSRSDRVARWTFWHNRTAALQTGRKFVFVRDAWLSNEPLPPHFKRMPIYDCTPNEIIFTGEGYSPGFDLCGPQEALNMTVSNILTTHDAFGIPSIWAQPGDTPKLGTLGGGLRVIKSKVKPEPLQFGQSPKDAYQFLEALNMYMELLSGVNSVTRGQPEATLKSGKALSIVEAKAVQFANRLIASYVNLVEDVATAMVRVLEAKLEEGSPRVTRKSGIFNNYLRAEYSGETMKAVERVRCESGNPLLKTMSGRMDLAELFVSRGWVKTPEEIMTVFNTGRLEPLLQADQAMLAGLAATKDALLNGQPAPVLKTDYHSLYIRECTALLNTPSVRLSPEIASNILSHVLVHVVMLYLPDVRDLQLAQGFQLPPLSPMVPPGLLDQIDPAYQGSFTDVDRVFLTTPMTQAPLGPAAPPQGAGSQQGAPNIPEPPPEGEPSPLQTEPMENR